MRRVVRCASLAACVLATACGGSENAHYSVAIALPCLDASYTATRATEGRYHAVHVLGAWLNISFEKSTNDALRTATEAKVYAIEPPPDDTVFREGNVVLVWDRPPTTKQRTRVDNCLARAAGDG